MRKKKKASTPNTRENGWERWRGEVDTRLEHLHEGQRTQSDTLERVESKLTKILEKSEERREKDQDDLATRVTEAEQTITYIKTKVAIISGFAGLVGGGASTALMKYLVETVLTT